ncbi:MAG TPA: L-2-amino-thiazoline-4-carboxylic acid hydrolase [Clostridia bacterium]|nr:L-2-amino-thiazoline-4-carboxylic acid hydrolase [Clostridia bacterium]
MEDTNTRETFTAEHHALLFAWIAREVIARVGESAAGPVLRETVRLYGEQRGRRMALRAQQDGQPLSMASYLSYREWQAPAGAMQQTGVPWRADLRTQVRRCCWATTWQQEGLTEYGKYYCQEIDEALVRGFNPDLVVEVKGTRTNGSRACQLIYRGAFEGTLVHDEMQRDQEKRILPWSYHTAHLYSAMSTVLQRELGPVGTAAAQAALGAFAARFGRAMADVLTADAVADFHVLPEER